MPHYNAFIITQVKASDISPGRSKSNPNPPESTRNLRMAALEASNLAVKLSDAMNPDGSTGPRPETLSLGGNPHRFIKNSGLTNSQHTAEENTPQFWSDRQGRICQPSELATIHLLDNCHSSTDALVTLALKSRHLSLPIYPQLLIEPDSTLHHHLGFPDEDVFGDPKHGGTVTRYLPEDEPASSWFLAMEPLRKLAEAQFQINYIRALAKYPDHAVIELDWNM